MTAFASDFDGTLFFHKIPGCFKHGDLKKIREFQEKGNKFGICTGRSQNGITKVTGNRIAYDYYILVSGALILDRDQNILEERRIHRSLMTEIYETYKKKANVVIQANDRIYTFGLPSPHQQKIHGLEEVSGDHIYGLSFGAKSAAAAEEICSQLNAAYGDSITAFQNVENVDMVAKGCSKGAGIAAVRELLKIENMGGIGDSYNDIPLLEHVDHPFTFPHAPEPVKAKAKDIVDSVGDALALLMQESV